MGYRLRVQEVLKEKDISIGALQRGTGLPRETIRKLLRSPKGYSPSMNTVIKVADYLKVTLNDLYEKVE
jgi:DNA-binding XRE family transcriptional regulator